MYSLYLSLSSGSPENFFKPLKVHSKNLAVVDGEGGDPPPFTTHGDAYVTEAAWPCRAVSHLPMFTRTQRNPASMFELIFFATRPIKRTYINKQIQCNLLFLSAGRQRKINQSQSASQKHIKVLLWTRVEQWPVSLIFNRYPARNPLFLTDKNYFGQESSSAAVVCMANRCKKRSILCHQNRGLHRHILLSEWLKN